MKFKYRVLENGKITTGSLESENRDSVINHLKQSGSTVLEVSEQKAIIQTQLNSLFSKVSFNDVVDVTRQLAIMLNSGLTIVESLDILKKQTAKPALLNLIVKIESDVKAGSSFSATLENHRDIFSNLYISLVKAGEASGQLDKGLMKLAINLEHQRTFRAKLKSAMIYPVMVIVAMIGVFFIMMSFVLPKLLSVYKEFNVELPGSTKFLMTVSDIFNKFWPIILVLMIASVVGLIKFYKSRAGHQIFDAIFLRLPLFARIIKIGALVNATRTLAILIEAGVSILDGLEIITETTSNVIYQNALHSVRNKIEKGLSFGMALEQAKIFPPILVQMVTVGEKTGHLDTTLGHLADYFESESEIAIKSLTTMIEPSILIVLGLSVGFVVISIITPIFKLTSSF